MKNEIKISFDVTTHATQTISIIKKGLTRAELVHMLQTGKAFRKYGGTTIVNANEPLAEIISTVEKSIKYDNFNTEIAELLSPD